MAGRDPPPSSIDQVMPIRLWMNCKYQFKQEKYSQLTPKFSIQQQDNNIAVNQLMIKKSFKKSSSADFTTPRPPLRQCSPPTPSPPGGAWTWYSYSFHFLWLHTSTFTFYNNFHFLTLSIFRTWLRAWAQLRIPNHPWSGGKKCPARFVAITT